jgi:gliding motility-associated-like protein
MSSFIKMRICALLLLIACTLSAQNSMVGDGFGGRLWYKPTNYTVGSYSAYSLCYSNLCDSSSNQLYGWGSNVNGELGLGFTTTGTMAPVAIPGMNNLKYYSTGYNMGAIKNDGTGWVWGGGVSPSGPVQVISNAKFLDGSMTQVSFVKNDGTVWTIGDNSFGCFGDGTVNSSTSTPVQMSGINNAVRVANSYMTTYVLLATGEVKAVGYNVDLSGTVSMLGNGSSVTNETLPISVPGLSNIIDIKASTMAALALDANGDVYSWGAGGYTGNGTLVHDSIPKKVTILSDVVAISACTDGYHFLALDANKNCYAWGQNYFGQFGIDPLTYTVVPTPTLVASDVIDIMAGETFSYIVKSDGSLWASGYSNSGSIWLDLADTITSSFVRMDPSLVPGSCALASSSASATPSCDNTNSGTITVHHSGGLPPYQYSIGNGFQSNNVFSGLATGTYTITITDANSCAFTLTASVISATGGIPVVTTSNTVACTGSAATLTASGAGTFSWSGPNIVGSSSGASIQVNPPFTSTYTVTGVASSGCADTALANVTVVPQPVLSVSVDSVCKGGQSVLSASGASSYIWTPSGSLNTSSGNSVIASPLNTTTYTLHSTISGCTFNQTVVVHVKPGPTADFIGPDSTLLPLNSVLELTNASTNEDHVYWTLCNGQFPDSAVVHVPLHELGICCISLAATKDNCYDTVSKCYTVYEAFAILIPNVFSPNGDGINEVFKINGTGVKTLHCVIYNRWGQKLYEWDGMQGYWDGRTKHGMAPEGTYYFIVDYSRGDANTATEKGFLTLLRD